jgi:hypothetical protein
MPSIVVDETRLKELAPYCDESRKIKSRLQVKYVAAMNPEQALRKASTLFMGLFMGTIIYDHPELHFVKLAIDYTLDQVYGSDADKERWTAWRRS